MKIARVQYSPKLIAESLFPPGTEIVSVEQLEPGEQVVFIVAHPDLDDVKLNTDGAIPWMAVTSTYETAKTNWKHEWYG